MSSEKDRSLIEKGMLHIVDKTGLDSVILSLEKLLGCRITASDSEKIKNMLNNTKLFPAMTLFAHVYVMDKKIKSEEAKLKIWTTKKTGTKELGKLKKELDNLKKKRNKYNKQIGECGTKIECEIIYVCSKVPKLKDMPIPKYGGKTAFQLWKKEEKK